jgi:hypothetical protein
MRFSPPKYYYHITSRRWPSRIRLKPKKRNELWWSNRPDEEPDIARVCVSPIISGCFLAVDVPCSVCYVYKTENKVRAAVPWKVVDMRVTGERWIIRPTYFRKQYSLPRFFGLDLEDRYREEGIDFCPAYDDDLDAQEEALPVIKEVLVKYKIIETTS